MEKVAAKYCETKGSTYVATRAKKDLKNEDWETFSAVARKATANSTYKYKGINPRQRGKRKSDGNKRTGGRDTNPKKRGKRRDTGREQQEPGELHCDLCAKAGLKRHSQH